MSHTPGSWEWDGTSLVAREPIEDDMGPRWVVRCVSRPSTDDARLIAAAPEILDALRELVTIAPPRFDATKKRSDC